MADKFKEIKAALYKALETLGADHALLGAVGSWGDEMDDEDVLYIITQWVEDREKKRLAWG